MRCAIWYHLYNLKNVKIPTGVFHVFKIVQMAPNRATHQHTATFLLLLHVAQSVLINFLINANALAVSFFVKFNFPHKTIV